MYELIILSLLMRGTTHGYVIASVINDVIGPFARASNGRIYPLLAKLGNSGLISVHEEATSEGGRVSRSFSITAAGRARFRASSYGHTPAQRVRFSRVFRHLVAVWRRVVEPGRGGEPGK